MKTIKGAFTPTTSFLHFAKFPLLILIAVFGLLFSGATNSPQPLSKPLFTEIGGQQIPKDPNPLGLSQPLETDANQSAKALTAPIEIGGQTTPRTGGEPINYNAVAIGGQNQQVPKSGDPIGAVYDRECYLEKICIGGPQGAPRIPYCHLVKTTFDIGGNQGVPQTPGMPGYGLAIGGQRVPGDLTPTGSSACSSQLQFSDIGGNQGAPQTPGIPRSWLSIVMQNQVPPQDPNPLG